MDARARLDFLVSILAPERRTRIVDIGANPINANPYDALRKSGHAEVWGFEPQPEAFAKLQKIKGPLEHYLPYAVGDGAEHDLHLCESDGFSSLYPPNLATMDYLGRWHKAVTVREKLRLRTYRLDDMADLPPPDLLKIDVQGAERMVFENGAAKLSQAVVVISEVAFVPLYTGQPLFHEQARVLEGYGFLLNRFLQLVAKQLGSPLGSVLDWRKHRSQLIDGDAVFIRNLIAPETISDEQLKHLAICADSVFASYDLALKAMSLLIARGRLDEAQAKTYARALPHQKP